MNLSVAIVEDNNDIRQALEQIITTADGYTLAGSCINGEEALNKIPILNPSVVLMDINLGGINGIECVKILKELYPQMLFMMCTVYEEDEKIFNALSAGASGYILKKTTPDKLLNAILFLENKLINPKPNSTLFSSQEISDTDVQQIKKSIHELKTLMGPRGCLMPHNDDIQSRVDSLPLDKKERDASILKNKN